MRSQIVDLENFRLTALAVQEVDSRPKNLPGILAVTGPSGFGKTIATACAANELNAIYLRLLSISTRRSALADAMAYYGQKSSSRAQVNFNYLVEALKSDTRAIFLDEVDAVQDWGIVEVFRALSDLSGSMLVLIGTDTLSRRIRKHEQVHGRVLRWVEFKPITATDTRKLADQLAEVKVADDLVERLVKTSASVRRIVTALAAIERFAHRHRLTRVSLAQYAEKETTLAA